MAINAIGQNVAVYGEYDDKKEVEDKTVMDNDDFMMLLLAQMQHQDPTDPMDSSTILTQTSQLATMAAADDTNNALAELSTSLTNQDQFSTIAAIGKTADLGSDAIALDDGESTSFEVYFPQDIANGVVEITDFQDNVVATIKIDMTEDDADGNPVDVDKLNAGVYQFTWDGSDLDGGSVEPGIYRVNAQYTDPNGDSQTTRLGAYPIESVKFEEGSAYAKLGSNYVPMGNIKEIY
ncbi:MAG: flagellar hook capping FlgD N-terminal domain-containing protein [Campylobacterota bacterium]|nr:flagellar hook capping FlgD N-terminal domain-containing protein [Campylobacterota bacterium]